jgi:uncharacterized OsmC-like protein
MNSEQLKSLQAPFKALYRDAPERARQTLRVQGQLLSDRPAVAVDAGPTVLTMGLHPAAGGDGSDACSADLLLSALASCAGVTLQAVAIATGIVIRGGTVSAEGDLDFRGTLAVVRDVPVGFSAIRVHFQLDTDATDAQLDTLTRLAERYCVVFQTLRQTPQLSLSRSTLA